MPLLSKTRDGDRENVWVTVAPFGHVAPEPLVQTPPGDASLVLDGFRQIETEPASNEFVAGAADFFIVQDFVGELRVAMHAWSNPSALQNNFKTANANKVRKTGCSHELEVKRSDKLAIGH